MSVFVLDRNKRPLMPCSEKRARKLLDTLGFPRGYLMRGKSVHGFRTGDRVTACVPEPSKKAGTYTGQVTSTSSMGKSNSKRSIAFTVKQRAENAVARFNRQIRRSSFVKSRVLPRDGGDFSVILTLDDEMGSLMTLELAAPNQRQAVRLGRLFEKKAEFVYNLVMNELLDDEDELDN